MTTATVKDEYEAALGRYRDRKRPPYRPPTEKQRLEAVLNGTELPPSSGLYESEYREAATAAEVFDDVIIAHARVAQWGEGKVMVAVAAAARQDTAKAVKAVQAAKDLTLEQQQVLLANLQHWRGRPAARSTGADAVLAAVIAEMGRLGLPESEYERALKARRGRRTA